MRALRGIWIVGAITFTGMIHQVALASSATPPDEKQEVVVRAETPAWPTLFAAVPESPAGPEIVPAAASGQPVSAEPETGGDPNEAKLAETKSADLGPQDAVQSVPATRDASDDASNPARGTQDFRYLI
jgi:hypothetical protein